MEMSGRLHAFVALTPGTIGQKAVIQTVIIVTKL